MRTILLSSLLLTTLTLTACRPIAPPPAAQTSPAAALGSLTYTGVSDEPVTLTDGYWEGEPILVGSTLRPKVQIIENGIVTGDLNGDGAEDAVVLMDETAGGTGRFTYIAAVLDVASAPTPVDALQVGDRIQVKSAAIEDGQAILEIVAPGPGGAACCANTNARKTYAMQSGAWVETGSEDLSPVSLADLDGTTWRLVELDGFDPQPLVSDTEIAISFADGQISGSAGCNDYTGPISGTAPPALAVGPLTLTQETCAEPIASQESEYLKRLQSTLLWGYQPGQLTLGYQVMEDRLGLLVFEP